MYLVRHLGYKPIVKYDFFLIFIVLYETIELLICNMFGNVLECYELTGVCLLWTRRALANKSTIGLVWK